MCVFYNAWDCKFVSKPTGRGTCYRDTDFAAKIKLEEILYKLCIKLFLWNE